MAGRERDSSQFVLVLREHEDGEGTGYKVELLPLSTGGGASPRPHGGASRRARGGDFTRGARTGTPPRSYGARSARTSASSTSPRAHGGRSTREGRSPRSQGRATTARRVATATGTPPRAILGTDAANGALHNRSNGALHNRSWSWEAGRASGDAAAGGAAAGARGDVSEGVDTDCDHTAAGRARILRDLRNLLCPRGIALEDSPRKDSDKTKDPPEIAIPVFLTPKAKTDRRKDDVWNKLQIIYCFALLGAMGLIPTVVAFLPPWMVLVFAILWGLGSIGFPMALFGTSSSEAECSRHFARLILMGFSLFVIYTLFLMATHTAPAASPPVAVPSPPVADTANGKSLTILFTIFGGLVLIGHIISWATGCWTGEDRKEDHSISGSEELRTSDLLHSLLNRS